MPEQDQPPIEPITFTQHIAITVDRWPARTSFSLDFLNAPHTRAARIEGDVLTFSIFNGTAQYRLLNRDAPERGGIVIAELIEDSAKVTRRKVERSS